MNNPEKIEFWRKLSTNKKLIFAIPQVLEMIDMLESQAEKITELEEYKSGELARCAEESEKQSDYEGGLLERIAALEKERYELLQRTECKVESFNMDAHNFEQQAKACTDLEGMWKSMKSTNLTLGDLKDRSEFLLKQAKQLKEQG